MIVTLQSSFLLHFFIKSILKNKLRSFNFNYKHDKINLYKDAYSQVVSCYVITCYDTFFLERRGSYDDSGKDRKIHSRNAKG